MGRRAPVTRPRPVLRPSDRVARFFSRHLTHRKGEWRGRPLVLDRWQLEEIVRPVYDTLRPSRGFLVRRHREALFGIPKKNAKTTVCAGLGAYGLFADGYLEARSGLWVPEPGAEVYNVAGSKDQARVLFSIASEMIEGSPYLRAASRIFRDAIEVRETGGVWRVLAADARLAHAPNPSTVVIDEIWVHRSPELYEAFASAGAARRQPLVIIITTAGFDRGSIAWRLYQRGRRGRDPRFYFRWWAAPDGAPLDDARAWRKANPASWVTRDYLRGELRRARELGLEAQFRRFHLNQWTGTEEQALSMSLWDSCEAKPRIPDGASVIVAVDSAPKRDTTAIVIDHRDQDGRHHIRTSFMRADPDTGYLDYEALEETLRELPRRYDVRRILVDRYNMVRSMLMLRAEGLPIEEFPQSSERMTVASLNLYELLIGRRIHHGGNQELREHADNAAKLENFRGWRFTRKRGGGPIDGIEALAMAALIAEQDATGEGEVSPTVFVV